MDGVFSHTQELYCLEDLKFKIKSSFKEDGWPKSPNHINIQYRVRHIHRWVGVSNSDFSETQIAEETSNPWISAQDPLPFSSHLFCKELDLDDEKGVAGMVSALLSELGLLPDRVCHVSVIEETFRLAREALLCPGHWTLVGNITMETEHLCFGYMASPTQDDVRMTPGAPEAVEEMLGAGKVTVDGEDENCPICLEEIPHGSEATRMPCSHAFHGDCIARWLKSSHYCPLCRFQMPTRS